jgi:two-component system, OmpR family, sensor histidine kinase CiaH
MKNIFRPFVESVIDLKNNTFFKAKIKLTFFYTVILFILVIIFSILVYVLFINYITVDLQVDQEIDESQEAKVLEMTMTRLKTILIFTDIGILILISGLGYFLAGRTLKPIEKSLKDQKRFVSDSAHELRTPLTVMKIGIETVKTGKSQTLEEYKHLTKDVSEEVNKLIDMSDDLMFLSRSDSGKLENRPTRIDISSIYHKQMRLMRSYANRKGISIEEDLEKSSYIKGDDNQIKRLIVNLLKNAVDYNIKDGKVSVSIKETKGIIILSISDTGIGIPPDSLKHIFERFYKIDRSRSIYDGGSGLGLSIVKEIVDYHKATIKINSKPGKGTEVVVRFKSFKII